jgi:hypothetical protein
MQAISLTSDRTTAMVQPGESLELEVAQKYAEFAEDVWQSKRAACLKAKQQLAQATRAEKDAKAKRGEALAFLKKVERRLDSLKSIRNNKELSIILWW